VPLTNRPIQHSSTLTPRGNRIESTVRLIDSGLSVTEVLLDKLAKKPILTKPKTPGVSFVPGSRLEGFKGRDGHLFTLDRLQLDIKQGNFTVLLDEGQHLL
jgi:hypothetical protein